MKTKRSLLVITTVAGAIVVAMLLIRYGESLPGVSQGIKRKIDNGNILTPARVFEVPFRIGGMQCEEGRLYVHNASENSIVLLDSMGNTVRSWGRTGAGEGEFRLILEWDVDSTGIYVVDGRNLTVTKMDPFGNVISFYRLSFSFVRAYHSQQGKFIFKVMDKKSPRRQVFQGLDTSNDSSWSIRFDMPAVQNDMSLDGVFVRGSRQRGFYVCHKAGYFVGFEGEGRFLYLARTIDRTPPPRIIEEGTTMRWEAGARSVNISACSWGEFLYVLSRAVSLNDTAKEFVDVYSQVSGEYVSSFSLPLYEGQRPTMITTDGVGLYALQGLKVVYYRLHNVRG